MNLYMVLTQFLDIQMTKNMSTMPLYITKQSDCVLFMCRPTWWL